MIASSVVARAAMACEEGDDSAAFRDYLLGDPRLAPILSDPKRFKAQVLLTEVVSTSHPCTNEECPQIGGHSKNTVTRQYGFRPDAEYFYPASTVKLFGAIAACIAVRTLAKKHKGLDMDTPLRFGDGIEIGNKTETGSETETKNTKNQITSLRVELAKLFLVSDNAAFNLCYDITGAKGIRSWHNKHLPGEDISVTHKLRDGRDSFSDDENNNLQPVFARLSSDDEWTRILDESWDEGVEMRETYKGNIEEAKHRYAIGTGHVDSDGQMVDSQLDCSRKNRCSLSAMQKGLRWLLTVDEEDIDGLMTQEGIDNDDDSHSLHPDDREFLIQVAAAVPSGAFKFGIDAEYMEAKKIATLPDEYNKFFLPGIERAVEKYLETECALEDEERPEVSPQNPKPMNCRITITNKLGRAYGFSVDNAHVNVVWEDDDETFQNPKNRKAFREFFLAAVVETNSNGTVNDDLYEYETVADPWLEALGETVAGFVWSRG